MEEAREAQEEAIESRGGFGRRGRGGGGGIWASWDGGARFAERVREMGAEGGTEEMARRH